jgi:RHS repeat-associated protein
LLLQACFLGRLPLGIETSFADGSAKSWRFLRGPDVSGTLKGAGGARGVLAVLKDASSWKAVAADTLGNVFALAGVNGDFQRRTFDPWGNPLTRDASGSLRAATLNERRADYDALPLAWASQEVDPDTGLSHYHFREYSPSLGGWLTTDPIGLAGGYLNLRSYLGNRPADGLDRWGLYWDDSMPMPEPQDPFSKGILDGYRQRISADAPTDSVDYRLGQMAGVVAAAIDSPEVKQQVEKNLKGLGRGVKRAITDIPDEVAGIAKAIASEASKAVDPDTYIEMADAIAMLYKCRQNPCCWKKLMESLGEMPSATLEAAARKLKDLGNLKQEEVFEMLGKEWGRAVLTAGMEEAVQAARAAQASEVALTAEQLENLARFKKKLPSNATPTKIYDLPNGGKAFQANSPSKNIPGSFAQYEKQVDASGKTMQYTKTTFGPNGEIIHVKDKVVAGSAQ